MDQPKDSAKLCGTVSALIFENEENGYAVLRLNTREGACVAVGCIPAPAPGERLSLRGHWVLHPVYGEQFEADAVTRAMPRG
ncbi:MAG: ATP-dependent RecD-like DNA helicase, partial [Oscillospiraceae bacterium]|nr:ATP-dependent RecD-like DNA helicase [Oscillospiraceae bacterium]